MVEKRVNSCENRRTKCLILRLKCAKNVMSKFFTPVILPPNKKPKRTKHKIVLLNSSLPFWLATAATNPRFSRPLVVFQINLSVPP